MMKEFVLPFVMVGAVSSLMYLSLDYLPSLQFEPNRKSDADLATFAAFLSRPGRIRLSQSQKDLTTGPVDSEGESNNTYPYNPPLTITNAELCENSPDLAWIVYAYSSIDDFDGRLLLRQTWFNTQLFKDISFKVAFLLGRASGHLQQQVEEEHEKYHDIVQGDYDDNYNNLTLKGVMGLKWISTYCPNAAYAIKADHDTFVNIFEIAQMLKDNLKKSSVIVCNVWEDKTMPILRDPETCSKYCAKDTDFPGENYYPQYCSGPFYVISSKLVKPLYEASKSTPFFFIEDVYVTGMLTQKIPNKIDYVRLYDRMTLETERALHNYQSKDRPIKYYVVHAEERYMRMALWNALLDRLTDSQKALLQQNVSYYRVQ